jgi:hypothetical protein
VLTLIGAGDGWGMSWGRVGLGKAAFGLGFNVGVAKGLGWATAAGLGVTGRSIVCVGGGVACLIAERRRWRNSSEVGGEGCLGSSGLTACLTAG